MASTATPREGSAPTTSDCDRASDPRSEQSHHARDQNQFGGRPMMFHDRNGFEGPRFQPPQSSSSSFARPEGHHGGHGVFSGSPRGPMNDPRGPMNDPRGPMDGPRGPMDGPRGPMNDPRGPMNDSRGPMDGPRGPMNDPRGPMNAPRGPMNDPRMMSQRGPMQPGQFRPPTDPRMGQAAPHGRCGFDSSSRPFGPRHSAGEGFDVRCPNAQNWWKHVQFLTISSIDIVSSSVKHV